MKAKASRTVEELEEIHRANPEVAKLVEQLQSEFPNEIAVLPDGTGRCVYKVYPANNVSDGQMFLWIKAPFSKSVISWERQANHSQTSVFDRACWEAFYFLVEHKSGETVPPKDNSRQIKSNIDARAVDGGHAGVYATSRRGGVLNHST